MRRRRLSSFRVDSTEEKSLRTPIVCADPAARQTSRSRSACFRHVVRSCYRRRRMGCRGVAQQRSSAGCSGTAAKRVGADGYPRIHVRRRAKILQSRPIHRAVRDPVRLRSAALGAAGHRYGWSLWSTCIHRAIARFAVLARGGRCSASDIGKGL